MIRNAGIKKRYFLFGQVDTIARNPDLVKPWSDIGMEGIVVDFEFFRDEDLALIGRARAPATTATRMGCALFIVQPRFTADAGYGC